jgi:DNA-binding NarL/FixJ family response regulator
MRRILVVEDSQSTVAGCIQLFKHDDFEVQHCRSYNRALNLFTSSFNPDVVLIDVLIPTYEDGKADANTSDKGLGFKLADELRQLNPSIPIVITSSYNNVKQHYSELVKKWGTGICFVSKDYHEQQVKAVFAAMQGASRSFEDLKDHKTNEQWFFEGLHPLARDIVETACTKLQQDEVHLTDAEWKVARFAKFDLTSQGLADELDKERENIHKHLQNIYVKLGITRIDLRNKPFESGTILGLIIKLYEIREHDRY